MLAIYHPVVNLGITIDLELTLNVVNASALTSKLLLSIQSKNLQNTPSPRCGWLGFTSDSRIADSPSLDWSYNTIAVMTSNFNASRRMTPHGIAL